MLNKRLLTTLTLGMALLAALLLLNLPVPDVSAQSNLLMDPGFEDTNMKTVANDLGSGTTFSVNVNWNGWYTEAPRNFDWQNLIPNGTGRNNVGFGFVRSGNRSMELSRGFSTFTAAVYQTVTVPENANLTGTAYVVMNISGENAPQANSIARVGIDPTGGTNPLSANVVWSNSVVNALASNGFRQMTVNATAQGTQVTLFLYATQTVPTEGNGVFWDDVSLVVGGPGGDPNATAVPNATPVPTSPPFVPFVNPQGSREDGSIVHIVNEGDTLSSIAVAYGISTDEIRELNPEIGAGRILSIGQELLIRRPGSAPTQPPQPTTVAAAPTQPAQQDGQQGDQGQPDAGQQPPAQPAAPAPAIRLGTVYFWVNDVTEMRDFYGELIGLAETFFIDTEDEQDGLLIYDGGNGVEIVFIEGQNPLDVIDEWARQPNYDGGTLEQTSVVIQVTDAEFDALVGRVAGAGVPVYNDAILVPQVGQRAIYVRDPMGNTVQILAEAS